MDWAPQRKLLWQEIIGHAKRAGQALGYGDQAGYELELGWMDSELDEFVKLFDLDSDYREEMEEVLLGIRLEQFEQACDAPLKMR